MREGVQSYRGQTLQGDAFYAFVSILHDFLPESVQFETVLDSVRHLAGIKLTAHILDVTCWRLAGNIERLRQRREVPPWSKQTFPEWVPAQITRTRLRRGGRAGRELGSELLFTILAGTSCTLEVRKWWSNKKCRFLSRYKDEQGHGFCFSQAPGDSERVSLYPYYDPKQFVTLRCLLLIEPELSDDGPDFKDIAFSAATTDWNRLQHKYRARIGDAFACPFDFPATDPCYECPIGFDRCRAGTHAITYVVKFCAKCKDKNATFDPENKTTKFCISCTEHDVIYPPEEKDDEDDN